MFTILYVDDSPIQINKMTSTLEKVFGSKGSYELITAQNGEDGLEKIMQMEQINLVMTDVIMPKMNGLEMIEAAAKQKDMSNIICCIVSSEFRKDLKEKGKEIGINFWIAKPFTEKGISVVIKKAESQLGIAS